MTPYELILRWFWIATGLTLAIWIAIEDRSLMLVTIGAALLSTGLGATGAGRILARLNPAGWRRTVWLAGIGAVTGAVWGPMALLLIAIKTSLHTHPVPDFTESDVVAILNRIPIWTVIGAILGPGIGVLSMADRTSIQTDE